MTVQLISIGFGNFVSANRVISIVSPESAPIKRMISDSKERGNLIDATCGKKTKSVIITDSDHLILSALTPEKMAEKMINQDYMNDEGQEVE